MSTNLKWQAFLDFYSKLDPLTSLSTSFRITPYETWSAGYDAGRNSISLPITTEGSVGAHVVFLTSEDEAPPPRQKPIADHQNERPFTASPDGGGTPAFTKRIAELEKRIDNLQTYNSQLQKKNLDLTGRVARLLTEETVASVQRRSSKRIEAAEKTRGIWVGIPDEEEDEAREGCTCLHEHKKGGQSNA